MSMKRLALRALGPGAIVRGLILCAFLVPGKAPAYQVYYANLHAHTSFSDGIGTPQEAYAYARDVAEIDVLALTEHTHMMTTPEFNLLLQIAAEYTENGVFVALGAQEFGNLNDFGHLSIFDSLYRNPNPTEILPATYSFLNTTGAFGSFDHPNPEYGSNFEDLAFYPDYADVMKALEIRNGLAAGGYEAQFIQALNNGWRIAPFANQDNHEGHWGDQTNPSMGGRIYLTGILADSLTPEEIIGALRERRFYAMEVDPPSDRLELRFTVDGYPMGSVVTTGASPLFTVDAQGMNGVSLFNRVELFRDGVLCDMQIIIGNQIHYEFRDALSEGESHCYFARATQVDSDQCWSAPVWVTAHVDPVAVGGDEASGPGSGLVCLPNPAGAATAVRWVAQSPEASFQRLCLLDARGRLLLTLQPARDGRDETTCLWDGRVEGGMTVPAGVYFWQATGADGRVRHGRLVRMR